MTRLRLARLVACVLAALAGWSATADAETRYDARLRFRVLRTAHFTIYFHQGEEALAQRLAVIAENVCDDVAARLGLDVPPRTHVVLVDQTDVSNGWSTPLPYDTIEITAVPPAPSSLLGNADDWLRIVFAHEYTHIVHLDRVGGWMRAFRWTLGRHPVSFPNLFVPSWQIEGIATYAESAVTGRGRLHDVQVAAVMDRIEREQGPLTIDRAGGGLMGWPSGYAPYFFGGRLYEAMAQRTEPRTLGALARKTARRVPFLGGGAFDAVFGKDAASLWRAVERDRTPRAGVEQDAAAFRRVTTDGFAVAGPRFAAASGTGVPVSSRVFYSVRNPHGFPAIRVAATDTSGTRFVTSRYLGETLSIAGDWLYYDQVEFSGPVAQFADVYAFNFRTNRHARLSRGARLSSPEVSPDGRRLAAIITETGAKSLGLYDLDVRAPGGVPVLTLAPVLRIGQPGCQFTRPRWSPDQMMIAAERQCVGRLSEIVLVNATTGSVVSLVSEPGARSVTPAWMPDGRVVIFASDHDGQRFQLYAVEVRDGPRPAPARLFEMPGGAMEPDVSADGSAVTFVSVTGAGYDVFVGPMRIPSPGPDDSSSGIGSGLRGAVHPTVPAPRSSSDSASQPERGYSPWGTLAPRAWTPYVALDGDRVDLGASIGATDVLGRHAYGLTAYWPVSRPPSDIPLDATARPNLLVSYAYDRWRPTLLLSASDRLDTAVFQDAHTGGIVTVDERSREALAGVFVPWRRARASQSWFGGVTLHDEEFAPGSKLPRLTRNAFRGGWAFNTSRVYGYSISAEDGARGAVNVERVTPVLGADGEATSTTIDVRAYLPAGGLHRVLALRAAVGVSSGEPGARRQYSIGGASASAAPFDMGRRTLGLLRGLDEDARVGNALAVANLDYRVPLVRVDRGIGTAPFFVRSVHGAVFIDIAATGATLGTTHAPAWSAGVEFASDLTIAYAYPLTIAAGAAWVRNPLDAQHPGRFAFYVRTGHAF